MSGFSGSSLTPSRAAPLPPSARPNDGFLPSNSYNNHPASASQQQQMSPSNSMGLGAGGGSYSGTLRPIVSSNPSPTSSGLFPPPNQGGGGGSGGIIRRGYVSVKEDGLRSWIWAKKWLALREQSLTFHKNEVS